LGFLFYPGAVFYGISVGVPGLINLMEETPKKFGRLKWGGFFIEPIKIAGGGFSVSPALHNTLPYMRFLKTVEPASSLYFEKNNLIQLEPIKIGSILINQEYAKTLKRISKNGADEFYKGETAHMIIDAVNNSENVSDILTLEDFQNYIVFWRDPLCVKYREHQLCGLPPPAGNISVFMILKMLENYDVNSFQPTSPEFIPFYSEISALTYRDRNFFLADPDYVNIPIEGLLNEKYLRDRVSVVSETNSIRNPKPGNPEGAKQYSENIDISRDSTSPLKGRPLWECRFHAP
jgi:Gamma-glutamyltransferase